MLDGDVEMPYFETEPIREREGEGEGEGEDGGDCWDQDADG